MVNWVSVDAIDVGLIDRERDPSPWPSPARGEGSLDAGMV
jgi:hypothetical protein